MSDLRSAEPNWDMTPYFPAFGGEAYAAFRDTLRHDVAGLLRLCESIAPAAQAGLPLWVDVLVRLEDAWSRSAHLASYLGCIGAADARDEEIKRETAAAAAARVELEKVLVAVRAALRELDAARFAELMDEPLLSDVAFFVSRLRERAVLSMPAELEVLAAELGVDGLSAWGRLYDRVSGSLEFELERADGSRERLPVSLTRSLLEAADPKLRRAALAGSNAAWQSVGEVTASCLNAIAGTRLTLQRRRGVSHFLEPALFDAAISRRTLGAMLEAVRARAEIPRGYLRRKAALIGRERLGFQDLMAPLPFETADRIPWADARERVLAAFSAFQPELARFAEMAFEKRWIDYEPRVGKRPGGFCSTSYVLGESRIFITYNGAAGDVATLAHELGHAWHGWLMRDMRPWARRYPMTLAETASTFAESLLIDHVLSGGDASAMEQAVMLDHRMQDAATYLLNILMRFEFEQRVYEERAEGELSVGRLQELMRAAQQSCYGDALAEDELDPWFWASKLHFYITGLSFYNFPYTFGYLFSLGIFARAKQEGPDFLPRYRDLLRRTGSATAEAVALQCLGVELEKPDFWHASIDLIEQDGLRFEKTLTEVVRDSR